MGGAVSVNFGLVHAPAQFDYSVSIDQIPHEIIETIEEAANEEIFNQHSLEELLASFTTEELHLLRWRMCWKAMARRKQLPPVEFETMEKTIWGIRSGRGFGKTLCAANWMGIEACDYPSHYAVVSPTHDDVRYTCFEGPTGLDACIPPQLIIDENRSLPSRTLWNGSIIRGFAGDTPERLRGPQHAAAWCDEIASWKYPQAAWDNLMFGLRLGERPRVVWTGTPKPTPFVRRLQEEKNGVVTVGSTYENRENLTDFFYENVAKYEGTKIGRQELYGEVLDPEEEGFVKRSQWRLWPHNRPLPKFQYIIYSMDTAFTERSHDKKEQENDPTACSVWGMFSLKIGKKVEKHVMLLDCWEEWLGFPELIKVIKKERKLTYGDADEPVVKAKIIPAHQRARHQGRPVDLILIEEKSSGKSVIQALAAENILAQGYNPGQDDKLTRLHLVSPLWAHGRVWAVESEVHPGKVKGWADPLVSQVCSYVGEGSTERDDLLDSATQALKLFMDKFFGPLTVKNDPEELKRQRALEEQRKRKRRRNPYGE